MSDAPSTLTIYGSEKMTVTYSATQWAFVNTHENMDSSWFLKSKL